MSTEQLLLAWIGVPLCVIGVALAVLVARKRFTALPRDRAVSIGIATVTIAAAWKLAAFAALVAVPVGTMAVANYHTFGGVHEVEACARCHVMRPMVNDLRDPTSDTLAARHARNGWIPTQQCYQCHSDYGFSGDLAAKMEGYRHLARYTSRTYHEPIISRTVFDNGNCLKCHGGTPKFEAVRSHHTIRDWLDTNQASCLTCHGLAHPTRAARTPGSPDYARLMGTPP